MPQTRPQLPVLLATLAILAVPIYGCPSSHETLDATVLADAGIRADSGAAGDSGGGGEVDAGGGDSGEAPADSGIGEEDSGVAPADGGISPNALIVRTRDGRLPLAGAGVVFLDPTGAVTSSGRTDVNGEAHAVVAPGSQVAVLFENIFTVFGPSKSVQTVYDVNPGEVITFQSARPPYDETILGDVTVMLPGSVPLATTYYAEVNCRARVFNDPTQPMTIDITAGCAGNSSSMAIIAYAFDSEGNLLRHTELQDVAIAPNTLAVMPRWETALSTVWMSFSNIPPDAALADIGFGRKFQEFELALGNINANLAAGETQTLFNTFSVGDAQRARLMVLYSSARLAVLDRVLPRNDAVHFDLLELLPFPESLTVADATSARPTISWTQTSTEGVDLVHAYFLVRPGVEWQIWAPPSAAELKFPELPIEYESYRPDPEIPLTAEHGIEFIDFSTVASWSGLKAMLGEFTLDQSPNNLPKNASIGAYVRSSAGE